MKALATVLYEDQRAPQKTRFGPHALALGKPMDDPQVVRALGKHAGHPEARDAILHAAAAGDLAVRRAILTAVPSFARVVRGLVAAFTAADEQLSEAP